MLRHLMLCMDFNFAVLDTRPWPLGERRWGQRLMPVPAGARLGAAACTLSSARPCSASAPAGKSVNIVDLSGLRMSDAAGEAFRFISKAGALLSLHYPGRLHRAFLINAPSWWSIVWRLVSPLIDAKTRELMHVYSIKVVAGGLGGWVGVWGKGAAAPSCKPPVLRSPGCDLPASRVPPARAGQGGGAGRAAGMDRCRRAAAGLWRRQHRRAVQMQPGAAAVGARAQQHQGQPGGAERGRQQRGGRQLDRQQCGGRERAKHALRRGTAASAWLQHYEWASRRVQHEMMNRQEIQLEIPRRHPVVVSLRLWLGWGWKGWLVYRGCWGRAQCCLDWRQPGTPGQQRAALPAAHPRLSGRRGGSIIELRKSQSGSTTLDFLNSTLRCSVACPMAVRKPCGSGETRGAATRLHGRATAWAPAERCRASAVTLATVCHLGGAGAGRAAAAYAVAGAGQAVGAGEHIEGLATLAAATAGQPPVARIVDGREAERLPRRAALMGHLRQRRGNAVVAPRALCLCSRIIPGRQAGGYRVRQA